jgi:hypothetical protein
LEDEEFVAEMLSGLGSGGDEVELKALVSRQVKGDYSRTEGTMGRPVMFLGGENVNTAPSLQGLFFNTRHVGCEMVGDEMNFDAGGSDDGYELFPKIRTREMPEWNHWGMWLDELKGANAENSGMKQPAFPFYEMSGRVQLLPGAVRVLAVVKTSSLGLKAGEPDRLRWYLARVDEKSELPGREGEHPEWVQAMVLQSRDVGADGRDAAGWVTALEQGCEVVDFAATRNGGVLMAGTDYHFVNGRGLKRAWAEGAEEEVFGAPKEMPEGTVYDDQVMRLNRMVGFEFRCYDESWEMTRDIERPEVVDDVFKEVRTEWPMRPDHDESKMPNVTMNVQRPIFSMERAKGTLPEVGEVLMHRLGPNRVLLIRRAGKR